MHHSMDGYKLLLLRSGETIIADVSEKKTNGKKTIQIDRPMTANFKTVIAESGSVKTEGILLQRWMPMSTEASFTLPDDWVVTVAIPNDTIMEFYEKAKAFIDNPDAEEIPELEDDDEDEESLDDDDWSVDEEEFPFSGNPKMRDRWRGILDE